MKEGETFTCNPCMKEGETFTCNPCLGLKWLIKKIINRIKGKRLKVAQKKLECSNETAIEEDKEGEWVAEPEENEWIAEPEDNEWIAEPDPGVLSLPTGGNRIKKLLFREELFDVWGAETWWHENCDNIVELYSVIQSSPSNDEKAQLGLTNLVNVSYAHR